jgi:hypothetical protein
MTFNHDRPVAVLVRDAETKQPIPQAEVRISVAANSASTAGQTILTQADGVARLSVTPPHESGVIVAASATGYSSDNEMAPAVTMNEIKPLGWFESANSRPPTFVLDLYSGPPFTVDFVVPRGFHGLIRAKIVVDDSLTIPTGQRCFRCEVTSSGAVDVKGPSALRQVGPAGFHAAYSDGTPLTDVMDDVVIGFRWLKHDGDEQFFVVGTKNEFDTFAKSLGAQIQWTEARPTSGQRGGKGGGRRRGGGAAGGAGSQVP